jgi:N-acetylglucosamine-6-phosphate deacetylase
VVGAHLYGPYFNEEKVGCHPKDPARPPNPVEYDQYLEFADVLLTATCAPELPGAANFYRAAASKGVRVKFFDNSDAALNWLRANAPGPSN